MRAVGGYYGGFRVGYDTLLVNLLQMIGRVAYVDEPLYHRVYRAGSLTQASATGMRSPARRQAAKRLRELYQEAFVAYVRSIDGAIDHRQLCRQLAAISNRFVTSDARVALDAEARRLRPLMQAARDGVTLAQTA